METERQWGEREREKIEIEKEGERGKEWHMVTTGKSNRKVFVCSLYHSFNFSVCLKLKGKSH